MDKRKNLSVGDNLALCFIAIVSIVVAIGASALFYYFETYVDVSDMAACYQVIKSGINIIFTFSVIALMLHIQYKVLGKTLLNRINLKKDKTIKVISYWIISFLVSLIILYLFETFIDKFDKYFLFMLLAIVEVCDIVSDYMMKEFEVSSEELSLSYLIFAAMIAACCYLVFNFSNVLLKNKMLEGYNSTQQFYYVTKNILSKVDSNNITELKDYVNRINLLQSKNELIESYAESINSLPNVINDEQLDQLKDSLTKICDSTDDYKDSTAFDSEESELKKALTVEGLLIFFISLVSFVVACQLKKVFKASKAIKKVKNDVKTASKNDETKKEDVKAEKKEVKKEEIKPEKKEVKKAVVKTEKKEVKKSEPKAKKTQSKNTKKVVNKKNK